MKKLLYVKASPRGERSHCLAAADAFVAEWRRRNPQGAVAVRDLFNYPLPDFGGEAVSARYLVGHDQPATPEEKAAWQKVVDVVNEFKSYDGYVFATAMWNFSLPYKLKHYIDLLVQPGLTFTVTPEGYQGLVTDKPAFVAYARGGSYPPGSPGAALDHQKPYFDFFLNFIGFSDIRSVVIEPTMAAGPETAQSKREHAMREAARLAEGF